MDRSEGIGLAVLNGELDLEKYRIPDLPGSMYYIPNFITPALEAALLSKISTSRYITLPTSQRRLQVYPAPLSSTNVLLATTTLPPWLANPITPAMKQLGVFEGTKHEEPNHCLVNEYQPGRGIMPHEDGEAYEPVTATISLGAVGVLELWEKDRRSDEGGKTQEGADEDTNADSNTAAKKKQKQPKWRILQEERSLLVTRGGAYTELLHGIAETDRDERLQEVVNWDMLADKERFGNEGVCERGTRVSLTFRDVRKVAKVGAKLFGKR